METKWLSSCAAMLALAAPALAVDGVREINQTCADTTGCFTGDTPGLPVTITLPGAYRLTGNLLLPNAHANGIFVATADVSIDLNGFVIKGVNDCSFVPACTNPGTGRGIAVTGDFIARLWVRNGSVTGMGSIGIDAGREARVEDVRVSESSGFGIRAHDYALVARCTVTFTDGGISVLAASLVADNVVSTSFFTSSPGIETGGLGVVRGNIVHGSGGVGIYVLGDGALVVGNSVSASGGDGIDVAWGGDSRVHGNMLAVNDGYAIDFQGGGGGYSDNTIIPGGGFVDGPVPINLGGNQCGLVICPP
jgi:hypothetical protein